MMRCCAFSQCCADWAPSLCVVLYDIGAQAFGATERQSFLLSAADDSCAGGLLFPFRARTGFVRCARCHGQVNSVADTLLAKALRHVCQQVVTRVSIVPWMAAKHCHPPKDTFRAQERLDMPIEIIDGIVRNAHGDLRNALHSIQFMSTGVPRRASRARAGRAASVASAQKSVNHGPVHAGGVVADSLTSEVAARDRFPDLFRTIGKILNQPAKRAKLREARSISERNTLATVHTDGKEQWEPQHRRSSFESIDVHCLGGSISAAQHDDDHFAPEDVIQVRLLHLSFRRFFGKMLLLYLQSSAMEEGSAAAFLHHNYAHFFSAIEELADAAASLSDAAVLLNAQRQRPWQGQLLPYVGSLAGRAVVTHNQQPAPSRFSQISKPQSFVVERNAVERAHQAMSAFHPVCKSQVTTNDSSVSLQGVRFQGVTHDWFCRPHSLMPAAISKMLHC
jgi:hypothetical protein